MKHETKVFYFVALKFAGIPDHHIFKVALKCRRSTVKVIHAEAAEASRK